MPRLSPKLRSWYNEKTLPRKTVLDSLTQFAIDNGRVAATIASDCKIPTNTLKMCLEFVEEHSITSFLAEVEKRLQN